MSCSHQNEKGCAILKAVEDGDIARDRFESWRRIVEEMKSGTWEE